MLACAPILKYIIKVERRKVVFEANLAEEICYRSQKSMGDNLKIRYGILRTAPAPSPSWRPRIGVEYSF